LKTVTKKKLYEAMFLVDSADAGSDWDGIIAAIKKILKKAKVDVVSMKKWDDRRLAYDIKGKSRGTYLLCYFRSDGQRNQEIETAIQLSEKIIRVLILCVDWMTDEDIEKDTPATKAEKEKEEREAAREALLPKPSPSQPPNLHRPKQSRQQTDQTPERTKLRRRKMQSKLRQLRLPKSPRRWRRPSRLKKKRTIHRSRSQKWRLMSNTERRVSAWQIITK
jgi:small subunit ribosomal protein S6